MFRLIVILLAVSLDLAFGDPPNRFHPLMLMGRWLSLGRRVAGGNFQPKRMSFWFGAFWTLTGVGLFAFPFQFLKNKSNQRLSSFPLFHPSTLTLQPLLLKPVFAYRGLRRAVQAVAEALAHHNLAESRRLLSWHLVSRDTDQLDETEVAGAAIESLAENLTDSVTAPLLAYAAGGLSLAWAYRFVNTADAMWGYRTPEFEYLGKFPARLDDVFNWLPARLTGWLLVIAAWLGGGDGCRAARTMLDQHHRTASLNAGWTMSAMAGALHVTLSKQGVYELDGGQEKLNANAIRRALRLADICVILFLSVIGIALITAQLCRKYNPIRPKSQ
ncbi:MAG: cobalamin biosynthesis protein CobD [Anaerolineae bacterium]|nr:cobalamin biosynthesis protein CobD [Anaerolineae bacterium]